MVTRRYTLTVRFLNPRLSIIDENICVTQFKPPTNKVQEKNWMSKDAVYDSFLSAFSDPLAAWLRSSDKIEFLFSLYLKRDETEEDRAINHIEHDVLI